MHRVTRDEFFANREARDEAAAALFDVPIASDLARIYFVGNRIEGRLLGKARRKRTIARRCDQREFGRTNRTK